MDHALSAAEWQAIRRAILAPSELERALHTKNSTLIRALNELGELEQITRASFQPPAIIIPEAGPEAGPQPEPGPSFVPAPARAPAMPPAPAPAAAEKSVSYQSGRPEYQTALGNQGLIEALLRYHRRSGRPARTGKSQIIGRAGAHTQSSRSSFTSERIPEVEVETKDAGFRRSSGISAPVLRTKIQREPTK
jgi:hypothetical protein